MNQEIMIKKIRPDGSNEMVIIEDLPDQYSEIIKSKVYNFINPRQDKKDFLFLIDSPGKPVKFYMPNPSWLRNDQTVGFYCGRGSSVKIYASSGDFLASLRVSETIWRLVQDCEGGYDLEEFSITDKPGKTGDMITMDDGSVAEVVE